MRSTRKGFESLVYPLAVVVAAFLATSEETGLGAGRLAAGIALTTFLPGFALTKILFPGSNDLTISERLALSIGASVAIVALLSLALTHGPWSIERGTVSGGLVGICVLLATFAHLRARRRPSEPLPSGHVEASRPTLALLSLAMLVLITGFWSAMQFLDPPGDQTEFYLLDAGGRLDGYPSSWVVGDTLEVVVGITSHERGSTRFRIEAADSVVVYTGPLQQGGTWRGRIAISVKSELTTRIPITLYRHDVDDEPYRLVYLEAHVSNG